MRKLFAFTILFALCIILFAQDNKDDPRASALARVNYYRSMLGLAKIKLHPLLNKSAQAHADYCIANNTNAHVEIIGRPGFTGAQPVDRTRKAGYEGWGISEDMASFADPKNAVDLWIDSVYHRIPFVRATLKEMGYGIGQSKDLKIDVLDFCFSDKASADFDVVYPIKGQTDVPTKFGGGEMPNPIPDGSQSSGYPITMTFSSAKGRATVTCTKHSLVDSKGNPVDYFLLTPQNDHNHRLDDTIAIIPKSPLNEKEKYTVTINAKLSTGREVKKTWSFTTGEIGIRVPLQ